MSDWLLLVITCITLYGLWMVLEMVFQMIDVWHQRERLSAAETRRGGSEQAEGKVAC